MNICIVKKLRMSERSEFAILDAHVHFQRHGDGEECDELCTAIQGRGGMNMQTAKNVLVDSSSKRKKNPETIASGFNMLENLKLVDCIQDQRLHLTHWDTLLSH